MTLRALQKAAAQVAVLAEIVVPRALWLWSDDSGRLPPPEASVFFVRQTDRRCG